MTEEMEFDEIFDNFFDDDDLKKEEPVKEETVKEETVKEETKVEETKEEELKEEEIEPDLVMDLLTLETEKEEIVDNDINIVYISIDKIIPKYKLRINIDDDKIVQLAQSIIDTDGIVNPLLVRKKGKNYELIGGERRLLAAKKNSMKKVPCRIFKRDDKKTMIASIIDNIQREQLTPYEEALAYNNMIKNKIAKDELHVALLMRKSSKYIKDSLKLLELDKEVASHIGEEISRAIGLALSKVDKGQQREIIRKVLSGELSSIKDVKKEIKEKVEETKVEETKVEETKVEETKVEETKTTEEKVSDLSEEEVREKTMVPEKEKPKSVKFEKGDLFPDTEVIAFKKGCKMTIYFGEMFEHELDQMVKTVFTEERIEEVGKEIRKVQDLEIR